MNVSFIDRRLYQDTLGQTEVLATIEGPGKNRTHIGTREGVDIMIVVCPSSEDAIVIEPCSQDREAGGSVHEHARRTIGKGGI